MNPRFLILFTALLGLFAFGAQAAGVDLQALVMQHADVLSGLSAIPLAGAIKTQGSDLYAIDPADGSLIEVGCVTSIDGIDTTLEQIETTCLRADARTYVAGLATPGTATFGINTDPSDPSHVRLHQLKVAGTTLKWAVGWSEDPDTAPTVDSAGDFTLPTSRSWITFEGFMNSFPFSFAQNAVVQSSVGIQVSGEPVLIPMGGLQP